MIPLYLDPAKVRIALVGSAALAVRRLQWLIDAGAAPEVWSATPSQALVEKAGPDLRLGLPDDEALVGYHALWIADLEPTAAQALALRARALRLIVNVEDVPALCDFHTPAVLRRGKLTLAAGTGGASPAVARAARERLETAFPEAWASALEAIAASRAQLRAQGASFDALVKDARAQLAQHGLT